MTEFSQTFSMVTTLCVQVTQMFDITPISYPRYLQLSAQFDVISA